MSFFQGKVAIITGSSNGIGRATAVMLAERGAKLTLHGRSTESIKETRRQCIDAGAKACDVLEILGEIDQEETRQNIVSETVKKFGQIDILVNNAGMSVDSMINSNFSPIEVPIENFDKTMAVNIRAIFCLSQLAVPYLEKTKGAIVNVSSIASFPFALTEFSYAISKAALDQLTVQLAGELAPKGVRVNSVNPGPTATAFLRMNGGTEEYSKEAFTKLGTAKNCIPLGRCGQPEDIAKLIIFLCDRTQSEFIIGQRIVIDGGALLQNVLFRTQ